LYLIYFIHVVAHFLCLVKEQAIQVSRSISSSRNIPRLQFHPLSYQWRLLSTMVFFRIINSMVSEGLLYLNKWKLWMF
jgi:hypothetical protein